MKKYLLYIFVMSFGFTAQTQIIQNAHIVRQDHEVKISFGVVIPQEYVKSKYMRIVTPMISGDNIEMLLPPIAIMGHTKLKRAEQELALSGTPLPVAPEYILTNNSDLYYSVTLPLSPGMKYVKLVCNEEISGCCTRVILPQTVILSNVQLLPDFRPVFSPYTQYKGATEQLKESFVVEVNQPSKPCDIKIMYPVNIALILPQFKNNSITLNRITNALKTISSDSLVTLKKIIITGHASPEGPMAWNEKLGAARALSLQKYMIANSHIAENKFERINGGPDWEGLVAGLDSIQIPWKEKALTILKTQPEQKRIGLLKKLNNGNTYRYIEQHLLPRLRNACYLSILYEKRIPTQLLEMYAVYDWVKQKQYGKALTLLEKLPQNGWTNNLTGICYQQTGDSEKAVIYFRKALLQGNPDAESNLNQLGY